MPLSVSRKSFGSAGSGISTQGQILQEFIDSMDDIRECISGKDQKEDKKKMQNFLLLVLYLRKLVPNRHVQESITKAIADRKREYLTDNTFSSEELATYASQLETITEVMIYLNQGMDLIHNDAVWAMTRKAIRQAKEPNLGTVALVAAPEPPLAEPDTESEPIEQSETSEPESESIVVL